MSKRKSTSIVSHAQWKSAHQAGYTRNGRLLCRGGRHEDERKERSRDLCRQEIDLDDEDEDYEE